MKAITNSMLAVCLLLGFAVLTYGQETTQEKKPQEKPVATSQHKSTKMHKSTTHASQHGTMMKEHLKLSAEEITALQNALITAGDYNSKANGVLDSATQRAIRQYQKTNKLKVTGHPTEEMLNKLGVAYKHAETTGAMMMPTTQKKADAMAPKTQEMNSTTAKKNHSHNRGGGSSIKRRPTSKAAVCCLNVRKRIVPC